METKKPLTPDQLRDRAVRFYARYGKDLEQIRNLLEIRLSQLALAYTIDNSLPAEAVKISARSKTLSSFLKKLERKGWPQFYYPTEVAGDLVGARVVCWFLDDCHGFLKLLQSSKHLQIGEEIEDYISKVKPSGYRSIHVVANVAYDSAQREEGKLVLSAEEMPCEIQI